MMKYTDSYGNVCSWEVEHPAVISNFFAESDTIDRHIQSWQYDLAIEKAWITKDCYFWITCLMIRMHVTDSWKLADYHNIINYTTKPTKGLWQYKDCRWFRLPVNYHFIIMLQVSFYSQLWSRKGHFLIPIHSLADCQGVVHHQVKLPMQVGKNGKNTKITLMKLLYRAWLLVHPRQFRLMMGYQRFPAKRISLANTCPLNGILWDLCKPPWAREDVTLNLN